MKILLIGEYSRLHNSLKEGLLQLGHQVTLIGTGDMFKNFAVDISIRPTLFSDKKLPLLIRKIVLRIFKKDLAQWEIAYKFKKHLPNLKNFDIVQLINSHSIGTYPKTEIKLIDSIFKQNQYVFLMACGDDYPVIKHYIEGNERYHILSPFFESNKKLNFNYSLKYLSKPYKKLFDYVYKNVKTVIPSDVDYKLPWVGWDKVSPLIPNPIIIPKKYQIFKMNDTNKIIIFLGINTMNYHKKGYLFFEKALLKISEKYKDKIAIRITRDLPFNEYILHLNQCHILLDTIYAYDQGYNALEAMARGKVVFTGAEKEFLDHYQLHKNEVCINALPNEQSIFNELEYLILHPNKIEEISKNARAFIEKEHHYIKIASRYVATWKNNMRKNVG